MLFGGASRQRVVVRFPRLIDAIFIVKKHDVTAVSKEKVFAEQAVDSFCSEMQEKSLIDPSGLLYRI